MKKIIALALCLIILGSLCLMISTRTVIAAAVGYTHTVYSQQTAATFDGKWTSNTEWTDGLQTSITANSVFRDKWNMVSFDPITVTQSILIEILNDTTNDAGDYWQICFDGNMDGGTAPQADDLRIDIVGHSTVTWYRGTGTGWTPMATPSAAQFQWSNSISASPISSTPHWICELMIEKTSVGVGAQFWARIAVYDASNSAAGVHSWPPTSRDVPNAWGDFPYSSDPLPSGSNPTPTPTATPSPTPAPTLTPTPTPTPTSTATPTATPTPTSTPTSSPTPTPTATPAPTAAPTAAPTPIPTRTPTPTVKPTATPTPTATSTPTPSPSETPTPTPSATETPTETPTPSATETPTETPIPSPSPQPETAPSNDIYIIAAAVVVIIVVAGAVIFWKMKKK